MTRHAEFVRGLELVSYKPGWTFEINPVAPGSSSLILTVQYTGYDTNAHTDVVFTRRVPSELYPDDLDQWLWQTLIDIEREEAGEWYRVNGARPHNPHMAPLTP